MFYGRHFYNEILYVTFTLGETSIFIYFVCKKFKHKAKSAIINYIDIFGTKTIIEITL